MTMAKYAVVYDKGDKNGRKTYETDSMNDAFMFIYINQPVRVVAIRVPREGEPK